MIQFRGMIRFDELSPAEAEAEIRALTAALLRSADSHSVRYPSQAAKQMDEIDAVIKKASE